MKSYIGLATVSICFLIVRVISITDESKKGQKIVRYFKDRHLTHATTLSPPSVVVCSEIPEDRFFWYYNKENDQDIKKNCGWLSSQTMKKKRNICATAESAQDGTPPAKEVCRVSCLMEDPLDVFYWYYNAKDGSDLKKNCGWLSHQNPKQIQNICAIIQSGQDGTPPAKDVCTATCFTCSIEMPTSITLSSADIIPTMHVAPSDNCFDDPDTKFLIGFDDEGKAIKRRCHFLNKPENIEKACTLTERHEKLPLASEICKKTCDICSSAPSLGPSTTPTKAPSMLPPASSTPTTNAPKKPNMIIILADDVGTGDIPFFWKGLNTSLVEMPNIKKLADQGVLFEDAHSTPFCAPSRYMLLSGNYPHGGNAAFGMFTLHRDQNQFKMDQKSIAQVLRDSAGYNTGVFGKWHLGGKIPPNGMQKKSHILTDPRHNWTQPLMEGAGDTGFNHSFISIGGIQAAPYNFFRNDMVDFNITDTKRWEGGTYETPYGNSIIQEHRPGEGDPDWDAAAYDMMVINETKDFIERHLEENPETPFFAYVGLGAVHIPHAPPINYIDGSPVKGRYLNHHLDMLGLMDKAVGSFMDMIDEKDLGEDTIIIFTSDNGGLRYSKMTTHLTSGILRGYKGTIFDGGHRVPMVIRQPGTIPQGERRKKVVGLNDLYATICELAGIDKPPPPSAIDSISFARYLMSGNSSDMDRQSLGTFLLRSDKTKPWSHTLRKGRWKFVHHPHNDTMFMFDMENDISEVFNRLEINATDEIREMAIEMCKELREIGPCPVNGTDTYKDRCDYENFRHDINYCEISES